MRYIVHSIVVLVLLLLHQVVDVSEQQTIIFASTRHHVELLHEVCIKASLQV